MDRSSGFTQLSTEWMSIWSGCFLFNIDTTLVCHLLIRWWSLSGARLCIASCNAASSPNCSKEWRDSSDLRSVKPREVNDYMFIGPWACLCRFFEAPALSRLTSKELKSFLNGAWLHITLGFLLSSSFGRSSPFCLSASSTPEGICCDYISSALCLAYERDFLKPIGDLWVIFWSDNFDEASRSWRSEPFSAISSSLIRSGCKVCSFFPESMSEFLEWLWVCLKGDCSMLPVG